MSTAAAPRASVRRRLTAPRSGRQALVAGPLLLVGTLALSVGGGFITKALMPDSSGTTRALVVVTLMTGVALAIRPWYGSWSDLGINGRASWTHSRLLVLPLALALSPLAFGIQTLPPRPGWCCWPATP